MQLLTTCHADVRAVRLLPRESVSSVADTSELLTRFWGMQGCDLRPPGEERPVAWWGFEVRRGVVM
jgi:hypothetical protein